MMDSRHPSDQTQPPYNTQHKHDNQHKPHAQKTAAKTPSKPQPDSTVSRWANSLADTALQRSWRQAWLYPLLFVLALLLSLSTYLTLDSIEQSVDAYVADNQRALVGGDLILNSKQDWSEDITTLVSDEFATDKHVYDYQFNAMISTQDPTASQSTSQSTSQASSQSQSLLASIKAVTTGYPLYGEVELASGQTLWQQMQPNTVVVESQVLTALGVQVGDCIRVGEASFVVVDELIVEPDRPLTAFGIGARVLMRADDLPQTQLMGQRSRINYRIELAGSDEQMTRVQATLATLLADRPEIELSDAQSSDTSVSRISDNVLAFLKLLVIAVLFLSAVALLGIVSAFVTRQQPSNAMRRAIGEPVASIKRSYYRVFLFTTVVSFVLAVVASFGLLQLGRHYLHSVLPEAIMVSIQPWSILKVGVIALVVTLLMVQHSLYAVTHTKPTAVLKHNTNNRGQRPPWYWYGLVLLAAFALMAVEFASAMMGLKMLAGMILLAAVFWLLAKAWLWLLAAVADNRRYMSWMERTAIHNLSRKGNQSTLFFVTLALSVAVLTMIGLLNHSLTRQFVQAYPEDAPNLFLLDVQSQQHSELAQMIPAPLSYYPVIRARIVSAADTPVAQIESGTGDDPTRVFNLSYADSLMATEFIKTAVSTGELYSPIGSDDGNASNRSAATSGAAADGSVTAASSIDPIIAPMSILDTAADMLHVGLGDRVRFNIQGIEIVGEITSIRQRYERGPSPFFYFLFEPAVLADAPQIQFATAQVPASDIPTLQTQLARRFPAITSIDGAAIAKQVQGFVQQMSQLVSVFTLLALMTGVMVLITSLLSTSQDRLRDSASFRLLGMQTRDLYAINCLEFILLGISAGLVGAVFASLAAWLVISQWFDLPFYVPWLSFTLGGVLLVLVLLVIAVSYVRLVIGKGVMARVRQMS